MSMRRGAASTTHVAYTFPANLNHVNLNKYTENNKTDEQNKWDE